MWTPQSGLDCNVGHLSATLSGIGVPRLLGGRGLAVSVLVLL